MTIDKEVLDQVSDDLELRLDTYFNKVHQYALREARKLKDEEVRAVCVDYPHVPAESIKKLYSKLVEDQFDPGYHMLELLLEWKAEAT